MEVFVLGINGVRFYGAAAAVVESRAGQFFNLDPMRPARDGAGILKSAYMRPGIEIYTTTKSRSNDTGVFDLYFCVVDHKRPKT